MGKGEGTALSIAHHINHYFMMVADILCFIRDAMQVICRFSVG